MDQRTVLVVDDESHVTYVVGFRLKQAGFNVITGSNGEEGFRLACEHHPSLIITDYQMPLASGHEMSVRLRENSATAQIPVLMLTARGHRLSPSELARTNIQFLLAKPFSARDLMAKVEEALSGAASETPATQNGDGSHGAQPA